MSVFHPVDTLMSWGRVLREPHGVARPAFADEIKALIADLSPDRPGLPIGLRRSYGDSNLNPGGRVIDMTALDRLISFDRETGRVRAEAGVSFSQALQVLVPAGWFLPTTPGTRFVTMGGAVANDVHGKNHHSAGSFGNSVTAIGLRRSDGSRHVLTPEAPLFGATVGGMGLTGVIEWVEFDAVRIGSSFMDAEDTQFHNVGEYFDLGAEKKKRFEHTMAWIDCMAHGDHLGRGIYSCANWARDGRYVPHREQPKLRMPFDAPGFAINSLSVSAFNTLVYTVKSLKAGRNRTHYEPFLYPLDAIANWNKGYGRKGFYQYQCLIPPENARDAVPELLTAISRSGQGSVLAVLKDMGPVPSRGMLSFAAPGTTLALDFQNKGEKTLKLMAELDAVVRAARGRLYAAKDGRISADMFHAGYPDWQDFRSFMDPALSSSFWRRVSQ